VLAIFCCFALGTAAWTQFTPFTDRSRAMLEGNWLSISRSSRAFRTSIGITTRRRICCAPHTVELRANRADHLWDVAGLHLEVALAGGPHEECESWFVRLLPHTSSH
jgi:hypothetical protein